MPRHQQSQVDYPTINLDTTKLPTVRSTRECRNVRSVITYICISVQVRFLKNRHFWKIKSRVISNLDRRIRNYYRNDAKQPIIHLLTRLVLAIMCEQLPLPYPKCPHTWVTFRHTLVEWTIDSQNECADTLIEVYTTREIFYALEIQWRYIVSQTIWTRRQNMKQSCSSKFLILFFWLGKFSNVKYFIPTSYLTGLKNFFRQQIFDTIFPPWKIFSKPGFWYHFADLKNFFWSMIFLY